MRCHRCNQDSIKIVMDDHVSISIIHIRCDICGLDIECGSENPLLCDLFMYNENLEEAEKLGKDSFIEGQKISDNPYFTSSNQIILNKRWELGYLREKESYELSALSLSSEKIQNELKTEIKALKTEGTRQEDDISTYISSNIDIVSQFCDKILKTKILGILLRKHIFSYRQSHRELNMDFFD